MLFPPDDPELLQDDHQLSAGMTGALQAVTAMQPPDKAESEPDSLAALANEVEEGSTSADNRT